MKVKKGKKGKRAKKKVMEGSVKRKSIYKQTVNQWEETRLVQYKLMISKFMR